MKTYQFYAEGKWPGSARSDIHPGRSSWLVDSFYYKQSGYGRENGWEGLMDYLQTKSVWFNTVRDIPSPF